MYIKINKAEELIENIFKNNHVFILDKNLLKELETKLENYNLFLFTENGSILEFSFSFCYLNFKINLHFLNQRLTKKNFSLNRFDLESNYNLEKSPFSISYQEDQWIQKEYKYSKNKPHTILRQDKINDKFLKYSLMYDIDPLNTKEIELSTVTLINNYISDIKVYSSETGFLSYQRHFKDDLIILNQFIKVNNIYTLSKKSKKLAVFLDLIKISIY